MVAGVTWRSLERLLRRSLSRFGPSPRSSCPPGHGVTGGPQGSEVAVILHCYNADGKHLKHGGHAVECFLTEPRKTDRVVAAEVTDNNDGTYTCVYQGPTKGSYLLHVEIDGVPAAGAPIPLFVGSPDAGFRDHNVAKKNAAKAAAGAAPKVGAACLCLLPAGPPGAPRPRRSPADVLCARSQAPAPGTAEYEELRRRTYEEEVRQRELIAKDPNSRTVHVAGIHPSLTPEEVRELVDSRPGPAPPLLRGPGMRAHRASPCRCIALLPGSGAPRLRAAQGNRDRALAAHANGPLPCPALSLPLNRLRSDAGCEATDAGGPSLRWRVRRDGCCAAP